jgi:hypothetical protein
LQIGQKAAFALDVGVADIMPNLDTLASHYASARHTIPHQSLLKNRLATALFGREPPFTTPGDGSWSSGGRTGRDGTGQTVSPAAQRIVTSTRRLRGSGTPRGVGTRGLFAP